MPILTERKTWSRSRPANATRRSSDLTPEEQANVRTAIRLLRIRFGGMLRLAQAMGARPKTLENALSPRRGVSAGIACRVARVAGVPIDEVLTGKWLPAGTCPHCGRTP